MSHDECYTLTHQVNWLVMVSTDARSAGVRNEYIHRYAEGADPINIPPSIAATIKRYASIAAIMNDWYWKLHGESRTVPFPADEIQRVHP